MIAVLLAHLRAQRARHQADRALHHDITTRARALAALGRATRRART